MAGSRRHPARIGTSALLVVALAATAGACGGSSEGDAAEEVQPEARPEGLYGIAPEPAAGRIEVRARIRGDTLVLEVEDDGRGPGAISGGGGGIGLRNVRDRLAQLYGAEASLRLEPASARGTVARVELPLRREGM